MSNSDTMPLPDRPSNSSPGSLTPEERQRLEVLKQQKNSERQEKERAVWRKASKPIRTFGMDDWEENPDSSHKETPRKSGVNLFNRLRLGRFRG